MAVEVPSWLNIDFTKRILRMAENDNTLQVTNISSKSATDKGDNYTSDMVRVVVEYVRNVGDKKVTEKKSMLFKFEPIEDGPRKDLITKIELFDTEIFALTDTLKKMNRLLEPESRLSADVYHVRMEKPLCLIMEDLSLLGFRMANRQLGLDMDHTLLAIRGLAKFHAASVALCEKEPKQKNRYRNGLFSAEYPEEMSKFIETTLTAIAVEMENWSEIPKEDLEKFKAFIPRSYQKGIEAAKRNDNDFNVINHGDCWVNNMMFRYDDNGKPIDHIFVDFQLCIYTSPAIDLHYFMSTSLNEEAYEHRTTLFLDEYLKTLTRIMKRLGCKTSPPTLDVLKRHLRERAIYELMSTAVLLPTILLNKDDVLTIDELLQSESKASPGIKSQLFREIMSKRMPRFIKIGIFDP